MNEHFERSLKSGECGEMVALNILSKDDEYRQVLDVRRDIRFRNADIDFMVEKLDRQYEYIEVKSDKQCGGVPNMYESSKTGTGNIFYELTTSGNIGCLAKTRADVIMYYNYQDTIMYKMKTKDLRNYVERNKEILRLVRGGDASTGYLLKIQDLIDKKVISKVWSDCE